MQRGFGERIVAVLAEAELAGCARCCPKGPASTPRPIFASPPAPLCATWKPITSTWMSFIIQPACPASRVSSQWPKTIHYPCTDAARDGVDEAARITLRCDGMRLISPRPAGSLTLISCIGADDQSRRGGTPATVWHSLSQPFLT